MARRSSQMIASFSTVGFAQAFRNVAGLWDNQEQAFYRVTDLIALRIGSRLRSKELPEVLTPSEVFVISLSVIMEVANETKCDASSICQWLGHIPHALSYSLHVEVTEEIKRYWGVYITTMQSCLND